MSSAYTIGIIVFDGVLTSEVVGPAEVFAIAAQQEWFAGSRVLLIGVGDRPSIRTEEGLGLALDATIADSPALGVVFNFGDAPQLDGRPLVEPVFLDGTNTISRALGFFGRVELMGIRFYEGGAYPFLGIPLIELQNEVALLDALGRGELLGLHGRLAEARSLEERVRLLEAWLIERLGQGKQRSLIVPAALAMLREHGGRLPIPAVAAAHAIGQRQIERLFLAQVGMTPRQYGQLIRVEAARLALKRAAPGTTGQLAADLGFYDQPHFIREFQAVIGLTPAAYLRRSRRRSG